MLHFCHRYTHIESLKSICLLRNHVECIWLLLLLLKFKEQLNDNRNLYFMLLNSVFKNTRTSHRWYTVKCEAFYVFFDVMHTYNENKWEEIKIELWYCDAIKLSSHSHMVDEMMFRRQQQKFVSFFFALFCSFIDIRVNLNLRLRAQTNLIWLLHMITMRKKTSTHALTKYVYREWQTNFNIFNKKKKKKCISTTSTYNTNECEYSVRSMANTFSIENQALLMCCKDFRCCCL